MRVMWLNTALMVLFTGLGSFAQSPSAHSEAVLARLSYHSGKVIDWRSQKGSPSICLAVYQSGYYQISRLTEHGNQTLQGAMSKEQLSELKGLMREVDFPSQGGGIQYLEGAESLVLEVFRDRKAEHYFWVNPGDANPLPAPAIKVVNWLEDFRPRGATPFKKHEASNTPICPSMNDNPLPLTSGLR